MHGISDLYPLLAGSLIFATFVFSFSSKVRDPETFRRTVESFKIVPERWAPTAARLLLVAEGAVVLLLGAGLLARQVVALAVGLAIGVVLIVGYAIALAIVLGRGDPVSCNCFGATTTMVSWIDLLRNALLIGVGLLGLVTVASFGRPSLMPETALALLSGIAVAQLLSNLTDVMLILRRSGGLA